MTLSYPSIQSSIGWILRQQSSMWWIIQSSIVIVVIVSMVMMNLWVKPKKKKIKNLVYSVDFSHSIYFLLFLNLSFTFTTLAHTHTDREKNTKNQINEKKNFFLSKGSETKKKLSVVFFHFEIESKFNWIESNLFIFFLNWNYKLYNILKQKKHIFSPTFKFLYSNKKKWNKKWMK